MPLPKGNETRFFFIAKAYPNQLEVLRFMGTEGISEIYQFEIDLVAKRDTPIDFDAIVGKPAALKMLGRHEDRRVLGIIARFELLEVKPQRAIYRALLVPPHMQLSLRRKLKIFQKMTTKDIVTQVLQEGGVKELEWRLSGSPYDKRDYCVQYRETDLDFVTRLLEEEGIAYHFVHQAGKLITVFTDRASAFKPISGDKELMFISDTSMVASDEFVHSFSYGQQLRTGKVQLRDYDFQNPSTDIKEMEAGKETRLEMYDYPGEFCDRVSGGLGKRLAKVRLQELEAELLTGVAAADCTRFVPGLKFKLGKGAPEQKHPLNELNQEYLLLRVTHSGSQGQVLGEEGGGGSTAYGNTIAVIPGDVEYRPPRVTPRPEVHGTHTAMVVGPAGEEIYVDKFGRVKVSFHWDRESKKNEESSCWIRVSQGWAGLGWGNLFIPRIGQEVLVSFIEGDPDRPLIVGRVYNSEQEIPDLKGGNYGDGGSDSAGDGLPANKTRSLIRTNSSPGGSGHNDLRFEDKKGSEQIYVHAEKDYDIEVENNRTSLIKNDRTERVENNQKVEVKNNRELHVTNTSEHTATDIKVTAKASITLKCGGSTIEMKPASITIKSTMINAEASAVHTIKGGLVKIN